MRNEFSMEVHDGVFRRRVGDNGLGWLVWNSTNAGRPYWECRRTRRYVRVQRVGIQADAPESISFEHNAAFRLERFSNHPPQRNASQVDGVIVIYRSTSDIAMASSKPYLVNVRRLVAIFTVLGLHRMEGLMRGELLLLRLLVRLIGNTQDLFLFVWTVPQIGFKFSPALIKGQSVPERAHYRVGGGERQPLRDQAHAINSVPVLQRAC